LTHVVFDIETNGLYEDVTKVHCLVLRDLNTDEVLSCTDSAPGFPTIEEGLRLLSNAERVYGHNIIDYDLPVLCKLYPSWTPPARALDTLVTARMRWAHIKETDFALHRKGQLPGQFIGRHSLEAWGFRMGIHKGAFGKNNSWETWSKEMQDYCVRDTVVTRELVLRIRKAGIAPESVETEQELAEYLSAQHRNGVPFDMQRAIALQGRLAARREELTPLLRQEFGSWYVPKKEFTPKRDNKKMGYVAGATCTQIKLVEFNPKSRHHIADRLTKLYGWKPTAFTDSGDPEINEGTLKGLTEYPIIKVLLEYMLVAKRLEQLAESKKGNSWMHHATQDRLLGGKITGLFHVHGEINQSGAVTHRATHREPNMSAVPKVGSEYGDECRSLFYVPKGWKMLGADASGLELRCLAHYMAKYDNGAYGKIILEGDVHSENRKALGSLVPQDKKGRDMAKTFIYAYLYGAGDEKLGSIVAPEKSPEEQKEIGAQLRKNFEGNTPALKYLVDWVKKETKEHGYLVLLDGRRTYVRHEHAALNSLLQSAGAIICKRWIITYAREMKKEFGPQGWRGNWAAMLWSHDEIQNAVRDQYAGQAQRIAVATIEQMTDHFKFRCPLTGEAKLGANWAETH
jgi:DNA polymerase-1